MAPRALGALFALLAALAFATALAGGLLPKIVPGWWDGHPIVNGKVFDRKDVHVGLLSAYGCNLGGEIVCEDVHTKSDRIPVGYAELGALGLIILTAFALTRSTWKVGDLRKFLGKIVLVEVALVAGGGVALLLVGPQVIVDDHPEVNIAVPVGLGMMVFWGGVAAAGIASVIAIRLEPEPLRLKRSEPRLAQVQPQPVFDVHQMLAESHEGMRPSSPRMDRAVSPGGPLPGHAGPLVPQAPLFDAAPQLRPLYENAGFAPAPVTPPMPGHLTPMPRAAVGQMMGIPTPPPLEAVTPPHPSQPMQAQAPAQPPPSPPAPAPTAPMPAMPPLPGIPPSTRGAAPAPRTIPPPAARGKPSVPPPVRGTPLPKHPTISHAIPPPPKPDNLPAPTTLPARDSAVDVVPVTAVEIDAEAKAKAAATPTPIAIAGEATDKNMVVPPPVERTDESATVPPPLDGELGTARLRYEPDHSAPQRGSRGSQRDGGAQSQARVGAEARAPAVDEARGRSDLDRARVAATAEEDDGDDDRSDSRVPAVRGADGVGRGASAVLLRAVPHVLLR